MNIRDEVQNNYNNSGTPVVLEFEYDETIDPDTGVANKVGIRYVKSNLGYYDVVSTRYTQTEQPYVKKSGDSMTGELTNTTKFSGGFAMEDRQMIGG